RPGGKGEFDIYFSFYDEFGNYQPPVNLENVNTFLNEHSPFYDIINHVLYFSSEGYKGFGGYDIFKTKGMVNESWEPVENCGYGINSGADDYYYYHYQLSHENYLAYFSSNRVRKNEGFYGDRIYKFNFTMKPIEKAKKVTVHCNILDKESKSTVKDAIISLYHEGKKYKVEEKQQVKEDLFFPVYKDSIYLLTIKKDGYLEKEVKFNASTNIGDTLFLEKIFLDKKEIVQTIENNREVKDEKEVKVNDEKIKHDNVGGFKFPVIYYGFGEYTIETSEKVKLDQLAKYLLNNPDMNIFVASHTDNVDNKNHNFKLSKLRTNTVIDYLVGKGVDKKKLVGQWYGEEHPKIDNQSETGKDNPEGRAQNRRTEFGEIDKNYVSKEGQMVENSPTFQLEKGRQDEGAILDEATLKVVLQKYGHINKPGLSFTVQVGAYINADANLKAKMNLYSKLQEKVNGLIHREQGEKYTKFLIGRVSTMNEAYQIQEAAKQIGIRYAFIVPYFKGDRVRMIDVIEYLAQ
ncbi:MAG: OmpA family protein, partial [bacterium]